MPLRHDPAGLPADVLADFPHLAGYEAFRLRDRRPSRRVPEILHGPGRRRRRTTATATLLDATGVQVPGVLDDVYAAAAGRDARRHLAAAGGRRVAVWAPTAQDVDLRVWPTPGAARTVAMDRHADGTWTASGPPSLGGSALPLRRAGLVARRRRRSSRNQVTDPYSVALTTNSARSLDGRPRRPGARAAGLVRADGRRRSRSRRTAPSTSCTSATSRSATRPCRRPSAAPTSRSPTPTSAGMTPPAPARRRRAQHRAPAAGVRHRHDRGAPVGPADPGVRPRVATPPDSRGAAGLRRRRPRRGTASTGATTRCHYTAPEGSYATDPDGAAPHGGVPPDGAGPQRRRPPGRHGRGLQPHRRVAARTPKSVLDRVVPGYYHRLNADAAAVENSHVLRQHRDRARDDGEADDRLGAHLGARLQGQRLPVRPDGPPLACRTCSTCGPPSTSSPSRRDGVDGRSIYLYGEGWNFGEVADDARFVQATQAQPGRHRHRHVLRPAARRRPRRWARSTRTRASRASAPACSPTPTASAANGTPERAARAACCTTQDLVKLGLAGNLADFAFRDSDRRDRRRAATSTTTAQPAGYAADPSEVVTYVDAHDNETLFDALTLKLPPDTSMADRVRMNTAVAVDGRALAGRGRSGTPAPTCCARSRWTATPTTPATGSTGSTGPARTTPSAPGCRWRRTTAPSGTTMRPLLADPALKPDADAMDAGHGRGRRPAADPDVVAALPARQPRPRSRPRCRSSPRDPGVDRDADRRHRRAPTPTPTCDGVLVVFNATPGGHHGRRARERAGLCTTCRRPARTTSCAARRSRPTRSPCPGRTTAVFVR